MLEFLWKYIIGPIVAEAIEEPAVWRGVEAVAGYNIYNTIAWAFLGLGAIFLIIKLLEEFEIEMNSKKALNLIPIIFLAGVLRFVQDAMDLELFLEIMLITPVIYVWIAALTIGLILLNELRGIDFKYFNVIIISIAISAVIYLQVPLIPVSTVFLGSLILAALYYFLTDETKYQTRPLTLAVMSQFFEAFSSIYGLTQGYEARQLLTSTAVNLMGPIGFLAVKTIILGIALKIFFDLEDRWRFILLVALYSIGFATGIRVILRASLGV